MIGFIFIAIASLIYPFIDVFKKKATVQYHSTTIFWAISVLQLPVYLAITALRGIPAIDPSFWWIIALNTPLLVLSNILLIKDEKVAPLSTTLPLLSLTPVFLIFTSYFFLGELPNSYGVVGIFLVVAGALLLKGEDLRQGLTARMREIFSRRSSLYILIIAFIWSFSATFAKMAIEASSVWFYLAVTIFLESLIMSLWVGGNYGFRAFKLAREKFSILVSAAVFSVAADVIFLLGLETTFVSYAIAIKRALLIVGSIALGAVYFRERNIRYRIAGAFVMVLGMAFILVFGR